MHRHTQSYIHIYIYTGAKRPSSAVARAANRLGSENILNLTYIHTYIYTGAKRPSSAVARAANRLGSENPRFKGENILQLELDMPERTTRDYEERDMLQDGER